jgi:hypothetical protein
MNIWPLHEVLMMLTFVEMASEEVMLTVAGNVTRRSDGLVNGQKKGNAWCIKYSPGSTTYRG